MSTPRRLSTIAARVNPAWSISSVLTRDGLHQFTIMETTPVVEMELNESATDEEIEALFGAVSDQLEMGIDELPEQTIQN